MRSQLFVHNTWQILLPPLLVTLAASWAGRARGLPPEELFRGLPSIFLLLCGVFALANRTVVGQAVRWCRLSALRILTTAQAVLVPYLLFALPMGCFSAEGFLRLAVYVNLPLLALLLGRGESPSPWRDLLSILFLWLPVDLRLLPPLWCWPPGQSGHYLDGLVGVCLGVYLFVVARGLEGVGYTFAVRKKDLTVAGLSFLGFAPIAISLGVATGFLHPAGQLPPLLPSAGKIFGIFLLTGIPEELLFRGLIQNLLERWVPRRALSLGLAALVFGVAHLNNPPGPDGRYFLLATLAGVAYGLAYRFGGTLMAPALAHTLVDSTWVLFFRG